MKRSGWTRRKTNACFHFFSAKIVAYPHFPLKSFTNTLYLQKTIVIIYYNYIPDFLNEDKITSVLKEYITRFGFSIDTLSYNFVSKDKMLSLNQSYLNHDTHTDIISFDYSSRESLKAEFFISMWAVAHSAQTESQTIENETLRVIVHGVLHCIGYQDDTIDKKTEMRRLEDEFIQMFHVKQKPHV